MRTNRITTIVLKLGTTLFAILCGGVALLFGISSVTESVGYGVNNFALWALLLLLRPAIMARRWLFEIPGAELEYHYYNMTGIIDYVGLIVLYYLVCLAAAWLWIRIMAIKTVEPKVKV